MESHRHLQRGHSFQDSTHERDISKRFDEERVLGPMRVEFGVNAGRLIVKERRDQHQEDVHAAVSRDYQS